MFETKQRLVWAAVLLSVSIGILFIAHKNSGEINQRNPGPSQSNPANFDCEQGRNGACGDGNTISGDGCSADCKTETIFPGLVITGYWNDAYEDPGEIETILNRAKRIGFTRIGILVTFYGDATEQNITVGPAQATPSVASVAALMDSIRKKGMSPWLFFYADDMSDEQKWRGKWRPVDPVKTLESLFAASHNFYDDVIGYGTKPGGIVSGAELIWADNGDLCSACDVVWKNNAQRWKGKGFPQTLYSVHADNFTFREYVLPEIEKNYAVGITYWYSGRRDKASMLDKLKQLLAHNKNLSIGEVGFSATGDCRRNPWEYPPDREDKFDPECQASALADFLAAWREVNSPPLWYWRVEPDKVAPCRGGNLPDAKDYSMAVFNDNLNEIWKEYFSR